MKYYNDQVGSAYYKLDDNFNPVEVLQFLHGKQFDIQTFITNESPFLFFEEKDIDTQELKEITEEDYLTVRELFL